MERQSPTWGMFTNHSLVLAYVVQHSDSTVREISNAIGITERATLAIMGNLDADGIIDRHRQGRCSAYSVNFGQLAKWRRSGNAPMTPATFADGLIRTLLDLANYNATRSDGAAPPRSQAPREGGRAERSWGFFSNHLRVLLAIADDSSRTAHDLADSVGITERALVSILKQLESEDIIQRTREGRRNSYAIDLRALRRFPRWSPGPWPLPDEIVDVSIDSIEKLAKRSGPRPAVLLAAAR